MKSDTENTSNEQLLAELARLRQRVDELETLEASHMLTVAALRASQERYQDLYQEAPLAYFSVNMADQRIQAANRQAVELSGYPQAELVGRLVFDLYTDTPAGKPRAQNLFERFCAGERIQGEELEMQRADGQRLWVSLSAVPILDESGQVVASRSAVLDITKRKETEEAFRESIRLNQALLTAIPDMMFRIGQDGFIRDFKPAKTFGPLLSPDDFLGKRIEEVMPAEHAQQSHYHLQLALQTGQVQLFEYELVVNNEWRYYEARYTACQADEVLVIVRDVTDNKQAEAEREQLLLELQAALAEVKTLSGLLPICASCKKIRDDQGYWHQIEVYIRDHSEADFSHGICPDCARKLYPDYYPER